MATTTDRAYEDFVPPHDMAIELATHTLSVDLTATGYKKEHIRVQLVRNHGLLVLRGERPIAGNRWSRFRLEFKLPDGCDVKGIHARFEGGVLRVTMPGLKAGPAAAADAGEQDPAAAKTYAAAGVQDGGAAREKAGGHARGGGGEKEGESLHKQPEEERSTGPAAAADAGEQDPAAAKTYAAAGVQDGGAAREKAGAHVRGGEKEGESVHKQPEEERATAAVQDGGRLDDGAGAFGGEEAVASSSRRGGYSFLPERRKFVTTVIGAVLVLFSLGIYVRYSLSP